MERYLGINLVLVVILSSYKHSDNAMLDFAREMAEKAEKEEEASQAPVDLDGDGDIDDDDILRQHMAVRMAGEAMTKDLPERMKATAAGGKASPRSPSKTTEEELQARLQKEIDKGIVEQYVETTEEKVLAVHLYLERKPPIFRTIRNLVTHPYVGRRYPCPVTFAVEKYPSVSCGREVPWPRRGPAVAGMRGERSFLGFVVSASPPHDQIRRRLHQVVPV